MRKPVVLVIDDQPALQESFASLLRPKVRATVHHPRDVTAGILGLADLVLVDLLLEEWDERANVSLALQPVSGLALAAVLRAHAEKASPSSVKAFAIRSGHLPAYAVGPQPREHVFARLHNLEWAFQKTEKPNAATLVQQVSALAGAVGALPRAWQPDNPRRVRDAVEKLLALPLRARWRNAAWDDIEKCHPPTHELSEASHGMAFLRWFLHRILPYPCFLFDVRYLAARLRVTVESLEAALTSDAGVRKRLRVAEYRGILRDFLGRRWWRAGVEATLWEATSGNAFDASAIRKALATRQNALEPTSVNEPVVCFDESYRPLESFCDARHSVRIQPDDWPSYAEAAWTSIALARDSRLKALVIDQDRDKLSS